MASANMRAHRLGWIGIGRMGYAMAERLAKAGCDITVWNRTRVHCVGSCGAGVGEASFAQQPMKWNVSVEVRAFFTRLFE